MDREHQAAQFQPRLDVFCISFFSRFQKQSPPQFLARDLVLSRALLQGIHRYLIFPSLLAGARCD